LNLQGIKIMEVTVVNFKETYNLPYANDGFLTVKERLLSSVFRQKHLGFKL